LIDKAATKRRLLALKKVSSRCLLGGASLKSVGWSGRTIVGYVGIHRSTVYRTLERWKEEGMEGLGDKPFGRPARASPQVPT